MVKEARDRVTRELREKIKHNLTDEAQDLIGRAKELLTTMNDHPRSGDLESRISGLQEQLKAGDSAKIEDMVFDLMRTVNEFESAAM